MNIQLTEQTLAGQGHHRGTEYMYIRQLPAGDIPDSTVCDRDTEQMSLEEIMERTESILRHAP